MTEMTYSKAEKLYPIAVSKHKEALEEQSKDADEGSGFLDEELSKKELEARMQLQQLEMFFKNYVKNNLNFSLNDFYGQFTDKHIEVNFHPTTESYKRFGASINGSIIIEEEIIERLNKENPNAVEGNVKFKVSSITDNEIINELANTGFHCRHVSSIQGYNI